MHPRAAVAGAACGCGMEERLAPHRRRWAPVLFALAILAGGSAPGRVPAGVPDPLVASEGDAAEGCRTVPGLEASLLQRHAEFSATLPPRPAPILSAGFEASTPLDRVLAPDGTIRDGAILDMGGVTLMVDDDTAIFGNLIIGFQVDPVRLARNYYLQRPDDTDVLAFFPDFDHKSGTFHSLVRNSVLGIGRPQMNDTLAYGSSGRLQSVLLFSNFLRRPDDPAARIPTDNNTPLSLLAHEFGHRFSAFVRFDSDPGPGVLESFSLLGRSLAHWCFFHDTRSAFGFPGGAGLGMSSLEGNRWRNDGVGTFTTAGATDGYSPLDLYLMGLLEPSEVPPFFYLQSPAGAQASCSTAPLSVPPQSPMTLSATPRTVTLDDVIRVEGPRVPGTSGSQRSFRQALVLVARRGRFPDPASVARMERLRQAWEPYFSAATGGRASVTTTLAPPAGPAHTFAFVRVPRDLEAGVGFRFALMALDADGRLATGYRGAVRITSSDLGAVLPQDVVFDDSHRGYRQVDEPLVFASGGTQSLTAMDSTDASVTGTRSGLVVSPSVTSICAPGEPSPGLGGSRPWGLGQAYSQYNGVRLQYLIHASRIGRPAFIQALNWAVVAGPDSVQWEGVTVTMANKPDFTLETQRGEADLDGNLAASTDLTIVYDGPLDKDGLTASGRLHVLLSTGFAYNGLDHLLLEIDYKGSGPSGLLTDQVSGAGQVLAVERLGPNFPVSIGTTSTICLGVRPPSGTPPYISGLLADRVTNVSTLITWRTSPQTDGRVVYGEIGGAGEISTPVEGFSFTHAMPLVGLSPGRLYAATIHSRDIDAQDGVGGPLLFRTTELRPQVAAFDPPSQPRARPNSFVRVSGANLFPGLTAEFVRPDLSGPEPPLLDPSVQVVALSLASDSILDMGVATSADAAPGPRRLHVVNSDGFETYSDVFFGVEQGRDAVDVDDSGRVDGYDLARLARAFGAQYPSSGYDAAVDFDGDARIDGFDLARLAEFFGHPPLP